jgi:glycosyltransferase involved in cell wall biosynthesis
MARRADAALVPGQMAEDYLRRYSRPDLQCERFPNIIDASHFRLSDARRAKVRREMREALQLTGTTFLFVGQFIPRKGLPELLDAFRRAEIKDPATLLLVGDGSLRDAALEAAAASSPERRIVVEPFRQIEDLAGIYASADALVLPSREEPWGFVVVEAMTAGLPVLASDAVGSGPELIVPDLTGWTFRTSDLTDLTRCLARAARQDLGALGLAAQQHASRYCSIERCVESFSRAVGASV